MTSPAAIIETPSGSMAIVWSELGVRRVFLPERDRAALERRVVRSGGDLSADLPVQATTLVARVERYFAGEPEAFDDVAVDLSGIEDFRLAIYAAARTLDFGETVTYGELAARAGHPGMARETGQALGANPVPLIVPCHRILAAGSKIGGFSAPGGSLAKQRMLAIEGVRVGPPPAAQLPLF